MEDRFKFRAWDTKNKKMRTSFGVHNEMGLPYINNLDVQYDWIVMQCTGLKDKNNKLIYEGDIFKDLTYNCIMIVRYGRLERIVISEYDGNRREVFINCFYYDDITNKVNGLFTQTHNDYDYEIIGNIYENPELLEQNDK